METKSNINKEIGEMYDNSTAIWEKTWGVHLHHGYYGKDGKQVGKDRIQAQIDLIEELLSFADLREAHNLLDVGCGIGGSSMYLASKYGASATGVTLSPYQANRANEIAAENQKRLKPGEKASFQVADAHHQPFPDNTFDLVWSCESGEHMSDKKRFMEECYRVLKPGGTFIMAVWCHRSLRSGPLSAKEQSELKKVYDVYKLPYIISLDQFETIAKDLGYSSIKTDDWTRAVEPFWPEVIKSALKPAAIYGLLTSGMGTVKAALGMRFMTRAYRTGLMRFGVLTGTKSA